VPIERVFEAIEGSADGELIGTGRWRLYDGSEGTAAV
jgi:hypothetical protein